MVTFVPSDDSVQGEKLATVSYFPGVGAQSSDRDRDGFGFDAGLGAGTGAEDNGVGVEARPAEPAEVEESLLRKLGRRPMSEAEVLSEAIELGLTAHQANELLDRFRGFGYVDDRGLAEQLRYSLSERKGQSKAIVARTMSSRSIDASIVAEVLADIADDDELSAARELAAKRASQMSGLDKQTMERRLTGYLARRGYPGGIVREAIAAALAGNRSTVRFR